jgi:protease-4
MKRLLILALLLAPVATAQDAAAPAKKPQSKAARVAEIKLNIAGTEDPHAANPFGPTKLNYRGLLDLIERASKDPQLDAVVLKPGAYGVGYARLLEIREALKALKRNGKKVFFYAESLSAPDLLLASVADRVSIPESGTVMLPGVLVDMMYMKGMLDKLHIQFQVVHIGEYKTAGESLVRETMSKAQREALTPILDEFYGSMVKALAEGRGVSEDNVKKAIDKAILNAREAKQFGLIDRIEYEDEFKEGMKAFFPGRKLKKAGDYKRKGKLDIDPNNPIAAMTVLMQALMPQKEKKLVGPKVAVVYCSGTITSGKSQYDWSGNVASMGSETIVKAIDKARKDKDVKAIVLRINSPGGSGLASDMIWRAVARAKEVKPVVASMGDVAASGGYYIAMNSNAILAEPQTITGSIGVVGMVPNMSGFYSWVGLSPQRIERGKRAGAFMGTKPLDEDDLGVLRDYMKEFYTDFVAKVAAGRKKTPAEIHAVAQGRVWTGRDALRHGLIDRLGSLDDAIALARDKGGIKDGKRGTDWHLVEYPRRASIFDKLDEMFQVRLGLTDAALRDAPELRRALRKVMALRAMSKDRICLVEPELGALATPFRR